MQRTAFLLAYFFICAYSNGQQYPFVHYTPKDGLISNRIRNIYQDYKGRLYFTSQNGLSVYDGARFTNYTSENGLANNMVNCVMEMGEDSLWIATNTREVNCLVKGKMKKLLLKDPVTPVINYLCRDEKGNLFTAADEGLFLFRENKFIKLPFTDIRGRDLNSYISYIIPVGDFLLVLREFSLIAYEDQYALFLYSIKEKKIVAQTSSLTIYSISKAPDGRIWVSTNKTIQAINTSELKKGNLVFDDLPGIYKKITGLGVQSIFFDRANNFWLTDGSNVLTRCNPSGEVINFSTSSGLSTAAINNVLMDKEGITWIATNGAGVDKLMRTNFALFEKTSGLPAISDLFFLKDKNELILYSYREGKALWLAGNNIMKRMDVTGSDKINKLIETPHGIYGIWANKIFHLLQKEKTLYPQLVFEDISSNLFSEAIVDSHGNLIVGGKESVTALADGKNISQQKINYQADQVAMDKKGNIWIVTRTHELIMFSTHPEDPLNYLKKELSFTIEAEGLSPRSITIDSSALIWVGTRLEGLFAFQLQNSKLTQLYHLTSANGLSENFISYLVTDEDNNIWACTPSGLDKISVKARIPVIENLTRQNSIYQFISKVAIDRYKTVWALSTGGLIKIVNESEASTGYTPKLMITQIRSGADTLNISNGTSLSYRQNNLSFYFAALSFIDEKQVLYSYQLQGSSNNQWTEPSNNAAISFIDLHPGTYTLNIKANFPAGRYPEQTTQYKFSISPPWWQSWWFRLISGLLIIGLLIMIIRIYSRRKLNMQIRVLEKQQAIEKERTRIATDMHDDLGAGLSRIKFLSQSISNKKIEDETIKTELEKITGYSNEMTEKMGEIVWALNEKNDTLADLVAYTRSYAVEYLANHDIACEADTPLHLPGTFITGEIRRNIFLSVKECLHNIVKHAGAARVKFSIQLNKEIQIVIHDNGKGIDWEHQRAFSNGIQNIKQRMKEIKGQAEFSNEGGTKVIFTIPLPV